MSSKTHLLNSDSYLKKILQEGVGVFKDAICHTHQKEMLNEFFKIRKVVMDKVVTMERPLKTYSDIAERHLGRLDYRCGFTAPVFKEVAEPILRLVQELSPFIDFKYYWGVVTSLAGSEPTNMHRDIYPFLNTPIGVNITSLETTFPPYYFTVLIPLVKVTKENGPTEFIQCSQNQDIVDDSKAQVFAPLLSPGDFVIFDGRTLHRGAANKTQEERIVAYITFIANWYNDQTFVANQYLFPELLTEII
jgi:ectoine hydroxylase-related dioxygenase (phytanoyl-CoA dioxygenase family)